MFTFDAFSRIACVRFMAPTLENATVGEVLDRIDIKMSVIQIFRFLIFYFLGVAFILFKSPHNDGESSADWW